MFTHGIRKMMKLIKGQLINKKTRNTAKIEIDFASFPLAFSVLRRRIGRTGERVDASSSESEKMNKQACAHARTHFQNTQFHMFSMAVHMNHLLYIMNFVVVRLCVVVFFRWYVPNQTANQFLVISNQCALYQVADVLV